MTYMLTGGFSSRLLGRLRVKEGLVYSVSADASLDERESGLGFYEISTSVSPAGLTKLINSVMSELKRLARSPELPNLEQYQQKIATSIERRKLDRDPSRWVAEYSNQALFASDDDFRRGAGLYSNAKLFEWAQTVTPQDVKNIAAEVFANAKRNMYVLYAANPEDAVPSKEEVAETVRAAIFFKP